MDRRIAAVVLGLTLVVPAAAAAQSVAPPPARARTAGASSRGAGAQEVDLSVLAGGEWGGGGYGALRVRVDGEVDLRRELAPGLRLAGVLQIGLSHYANDVTVVNPFGGPALSAHSSATSFDVVPALRVHLAPAPRFDLYADGGLGLGYTSASYQVSQAGVVAAGGIGSGVGFVLHLGGGGFYSVDDRLKVGAEVVGLNLRAGSGQTSYSLLAAVAYRL